MSARPGARLAVAVAASAAVVAGGPFVGEIRGAIQSAFPENYRLIVASTVAIAVAAAIAAAGAQVHDRRLLRFGLLGLSLLLGLAYARVTASGNPDVDAVERFHFVEYGLLAVLYHRVWSARDDLSSVALPVLAGVLVGTLDEWVQWFVPFRVGELRDVLLNGVALLCGVLLGIGTRPPGRPVLFRDRASRRVVGVMIVIVILSGAAFFHTVHLGHDVRLAQGARFLSRFSAGELEAAALDRAARWGGVPPVERRLSREDHYLSEARWHIQERNQAVSAGEFGVALNEQRILDAFYGPVLDVLPAERWPALQRADVEARAGGATGAFSSKAHPHPIYTWRPAMFWAGVLTAGGVLAAALVLPRRLSRAAGDRAA